MVAWGRGVDGDGGLGLGWVMRYLVKESGFARKGILKVAGVYHAVETNTPVTRSEREILAQADEIEWT